MKADELRRAVGSIAPDEGLKAKVLMLAERPRGFRMEKPARLIAAFGAAAAVCACVLAAVLFIRAGNAPGGLPAAPPPTEKRFSTVLAATPAGQIPAFTAARATLLEKVEMNYYIDTIEYGMEQYKPQGYPQNILPGLAWEMEKHKADAGYLYDAAIRYVYSSEDFKKQFTYNGMTYDEAVEEQSRKSQEQYEANLAELNQPGLTEEERREIMKRQKQDAARSEDESVNAVFFKEYRAETDRRTRAALAELQKTHGIEMRELSEGVYYSKFTRGELLDLSGPFTCRLVGKNGYTRPDGYPENIIDSSAVIMSMSPQDAVISLRLSLFCCRGGATKEQRAETERILRDAFHACGIQDAPEFYLSTIGGETAEDEVYIYVEGIVQASVAQAVALARYLPDVKIGQVTSTQDVMADYHFNKYGDGYNAVPSSGKPSTDG